MTQTLRIAEFATGIPELDEAREKVYAFARRPLPHALGLAYRIAEGAYAKFEARRIVRRREIGHAWLYVVVRRRDPRCGS